MAYRDIRIIGDPILRTECDWITDIDDSVKALVEDLLETVDEDGRAGLAANQIGIGLRAFSWNIDGEIGYILNPKIVEVSKDEYQDGDEGCLSVPGLWFPTERAWYARAEGVDLDGKEVVVEGEELMALPRSPRPEEPGQGDEGAAGAGTVTSPGREPGGATGHETCCPTRFSAGDEASYVRRS